MHHHLHLAGLRSAFHRHGCRRTDAASGIRRKPAAWRWAWTGLLLATGLALTGRAQEPRTTASPLPGIPFLQAAAERHRVIAIAEHHRFRELHAFIRSFLEDPDTPDRIGQVIVEAGNSLYQPLIDHYVMTGGDVPKHLVQRAWRDTTQLVVWDAPVYEQLYETVRAVNGRLPVEKRIRLVLADPPIFWPRVRVKADYERWLGQREAAYQAAVQQAVQRDRASLVILGTAHANRSVSPPHNAVTAVEKAFPGSTFVVLPHVGFGFGLDMPANSAFEPLVSSWPLNSVATVRGTTLGGVPGELLFASFLIGPDGKPLNPYRGHLLEELGDAYLFLGVRQDLTESRPWPTTYRDDEYWRELHRRYLLIHGRPLDPHGPEFRTDGRLIEPLPPLPPGLPPPLPPLPEPTS